MPRRRRTSVVHALVVVLAMGACTTPPLLTESPRPTPVAARVSPPPLRAVPFANGLVLEVPADWSVSGAAMINRATYREMLATNGGIDGLPTLPGNGDVDAAALPSGRVVITVQSFCRMYCMGPETETTVPLDWTQARPLSDRVLPPGRNELAVAFRWFDRPMYLVARWADDAPPREVAAIESIARSIGPLQPLPGRGAYNGWTAVGPLNALPIGAVRLEPLPAGATRAPDRDDSPFFVVRGRQNLFAFVSRPVTDPSCEVAYDAASDRFRCTFGGRTYEWTRFGRYVGTEPQRDLPQHSVLVRDGTIFVQHTRTRLLEPAVKDEAAEH